MFLTSLSFVFSTPGWSRVLFGFLLFREPLANSYKSCGSPWGCNVVAGRGAD
jgi:hypothetical protein